MGANFSMLLFFPRCSFAICECDIDFECGIFDATFFQNSVFENRKSCINASLDCCKLVLTIVDQNDIGNLICTLLSRWQVYQTCQANKDIPYNLAYMSQVFKTHATYSLGTNHTKTHD